MLPALLIGCASTYPSVRLARDGCEASREAMAQVTYVEHKEPHPYIAVQCAGCTEVYGAAQRHWLAEHYPRYEMVEHSTSSDFYYPFGVWEEEPTGNVYSCFTLLSPDREEREVCFVNSGWCHDDG